MSDHEFGIFDEVNTEYISAMIKTFGNFDILAIEILEEHGINVDLLENEWINIQQWMDAFKEIASRLGPSEISKVGEKIAERFFLKIKKSMSDSLELLQEIYDKFHQGKVGKYEVNELGINLIHVKCNNPYSCAFDKGMIQTIAKKVSKEAKIKHLPSSCRNLGHEQCVYSVKW
ncbi:MAG: hypothetical protein ACTSYA_03470 [Candidatus Kariarchaeaceae archaeon]